MLKPIKFTKEEILLKTVEFQAKIIERLLDKIETKDQNYIFQYKAEIDK